MPCRDLHADDQYRQDLYTKIQNLTNMLCAACTKLDDIGHAIPPEAKDWWAEHQAMDRERKHREAEEAALKLKRKAALAKLTRTEQIALGLKKEDLL